MFTIKLPLILVAASLCVTPVAAQPYPTQVPPQPTSTTCYNPGSPVPSPSPIYVPPTPVKPQPPPTPAAKPQPQP